HFASGDTVGTINGYVEWDTTLTDRADSWAVTLRLRDLHTTQGTLPAPDSCRVDVTPERRQSYRPPSGQTVPYRVTRLAAGAAIQPGGVPVASLGRVPCGGVRVPKAGCRVVAGADAAIVSVPPPAAREPFRFVVLGSATRGPARLVVRGEGADA